MIDGWPEAWERELMSYLLSRECTTAAEFADYFHLSDESASYWLGWLVRERKLRIARIEMQGADEIVVGLAPEEIPTEGNLRTWPQAILEVSGASDRRRALPRKEAEINSGVIVPSYNCNK